MSIQQQGRVRGSRDVETQWARLIDELGRCGVLARIGACDAIGPAGAGIRGRRRENDATQDLDRTGR